MPNFKFPASMGAFALGGGERERSGYEEERVILATLAFYICQS